MGQHRRFVFWQRMLCLHQSAHSRSLHEMGYDVTIVAEQVLGDERQALGWHIPDLGAAKTVVAPDNATIASLASIDPDHSVHFVVGTRGWELGRLAYNACRAAGTQTALLQEGGNPLGVAGLGRRAVYSSLRVTMGPHVRMLLAMGDNGVRWYRQCGWPHSKVFPYAYFVETPPRSSVHNQPKNDDAFGIIYVGQLIHRKGIDRLLRALSELNSLSWTLSLVGSGPLETTYRDLARTLGVDNRVYFLGARPNAEVLDLVSNSDLMVLPSRFDGWGAVVNEALMQGTPVVSSDACGASSLLKETWRGGVFPSDDLASLTRLLRDWIGRGKKTAQLAEAIREWSERISGRRAAAYLLSILDHVYSGAERPLPPWEGTGNYDN